MSLFSLQINFEKSKAPKYLLKSIAKIISDSFSQNIEYVNGSLVDNVDLSWQGSAEPLAFLNIQTICDLNAQLNQLCCTEISKYLRTALNIPEDRILVYFSGKVPSDVAVNGSLLIQQ